MDATSTTEDLITIPIPIARGGINKDIEPTSLEEVFTPYMLNMILESKKVRKRLGYSKLGTNLPLDGVGMKLVEYVDAQGTIHTIAITTTKAYEYDGADEEWDDITPIAGDFSGDEETPVAFCLATDLVMFDQNGGLALIMTNGVDDLFFYEGQAGGKFEALVHGYASFAHCKVAVEFWNHFMLINFNTGTQNVRSVAWADAGDIDKWTGGTSGLSYLTDSIGEVVRAAKLGADLILYSNRSITTCRYYGGTIVFLFPTLIYHAGAYSADSIIEISNQHQFISTDQRIYEYAGGSQLSEIGQAIEESLFAELDSSKKNRIACGYDEMRDRSYFAFPRETDDYAKASYCMNRKQPEHPWEYFEFEDDIRSIAMHETQIIWYFDDDRFEGVYFDEASFYFDASFGKPSYPVMISLSSDGYVYAHTEAGGKDDDADITCEYQTQDITVDKEEHFARWEWLTFVSKSRIIGGDVRIFYSIDGGNDWVEFDDSPCSLTSSWTVFRLPFDVVSRKIRFKFYQSSSADLQIRDDMHVSFILEPARD
jgi:hypothetical protein